ncbi:MAG: LamG domain-containing protein, partial [Spirochaetota bacterium]
SHTAVNNGLTFTEDRFGRLNSALRSDGTGTYLSVTPSRVVNELDAFTVLFRVRLGSLEGPVYLVSKWGRADGQLADGKFTVQTADGAITLFVVGPEGRYGWTAARGVLSAGRWHSVAVTFEDGRGAIYVDGAEVRSRTFPFEELYADDAPLLVMTAEAATDDPYGLYNAVGAIDDFELYDGALDAEAIAEWAAATPL